MCCGDELHHSCCKPHEKDRILAEDGIRDLEEYKEMLEMELKKVNAELGKRKKEEAGIE